MSEVSKKFKVGDKVVRTVECEADYTVEQWGVYTVSEVDEDLCVIFLEGIYDKEGKPDWFNPRNFELVKEEVAMSEQTPKTPYQEKGYTENSLFKFVGDDVSFDKGEIIKLQDDDGSDIPDFKSISRDRKRYCYLSEVEYVGEEGSEGRLSNYEEANQPTKDVVNHDNVNSPSHYSNSKIECIVAMEAMLSPEEFIGYLRGNIFKYQWRYKQKNGIEDLNKAQWYQSKLIEKEFEKQALEKEVNHG